jgi:hypothetical protein
MMKKNSLLFCMLLITWLTGNVMGMEDNNNNDDLGKRLLDKDEYANDQNEEALDEENSDQWSEVDITYDQWSEIAFETDENNNEEEIKEESIDNNLDTRLTEFKLDMDQLNRLNDYYQKHYGNLLNYKGPEEEKKKEEIKPVEIDMKQLIDDNQPNYGDQLYGNTGPMCKTGGGFILNEGPNEPKAFNTDIKMPDGKVQLIEESRMKTILATMRRGMAPVLLIVMLVFFIAYFQGRFTI